MPGRKSYCGIPIVCWLTKVGGSGLAREPISCCAGITTSGAATEFHVIALSLMCKLWSKNRMALCGRDPRARVYSNFNEENLQRSMRVAASRTIKSNHCLLIETEKCGWEQPQH